MIFGFSFFLFRFYVTIFFFLKILVQNLFGKKILRVFLILLEGVPFFFKGKQIKKFKLLYIIFFSSQGVPKNILDSKWHHC